MWQSNHSTAIGGGSSAQKQCRHAGIPSTSSYNEEEEEEEEEALASCGSLAADGRGLVRGLVCIIQPCQARAARKPVVLV